MARPVEAQIAQLPDEMLKFVLECGQACASPRLGSLLLPGRAPIATPHYVASTSRSVVPHIAHDMLQRHTDIRAVYMGLEDFVEKSTRDAPIFKQPTKTGESLLRRYTALPSSCMTILGARRVPRLDCPAQNTNSAISISTSVGFRTLDADDYNDAVESLGPDVATSIVDLITADKISKKRIEKSADRSHAWLRDAIALREEQPQTTSPLFASIPPLEVEEQQSYLQDVADDYRPSLSGLATYSLETAADLPTNLRSLPCLSISDPETPHQLLRAILLGNDLITVPMVTRTSELGLAFAFTFQPLSGGSSVRLPLALDMWSPTHATSLGPLVDGCHCYTCKSHHRAYIHHLLQAKEMLAWTLLQMHNFHAFDCFFESIRNSIKAGTFDADIAQFEKYYEEQIMPGEGRDRGPRIRGYQMKSIGNDPPRNEKVWGRFGNGSAKSTTTGLEDAAMKEASMNGDLDLSSVEIEKLGLAKRVEDDMKS